MQQIFIIFSRIIHTLKSPSGSKRQTLPAARAARVIKKLIVCFILLGSLAVGGLPTVDAQSSSSTQVDGTSTESCLACHASPDLQIELSSGEVLSLRVDPVIYKWSIHGQFGYACVQCHTNISGYPHPEISAQTRRDLSLELYTACAQCHPANYASTLDSVHARALAAGNSAAAICTDCHGAHDIMDPNLPLSRVPQTCEQCHSQIYALYENSVHGSALIDDGNADVPSCIDCHGVHNVQGPSSGSFHLFSPNICARCHNDPDLMDRYGIRSNVLDTYVADFHGTTVVLFEQIAPDQETNKPVCVDCHGVHDIQATDDPESKVIKENLLQTCQRCHPDATSEFPSAWLRHYEPSPEKTPLVYFVNLFYTILIPTTVGGMLLYVGLDSGRRLIQRWRQRGNE